MIYTIITIAVVVAVVAITLLAIYGGSKKRDKAFASWPAAARKLRLRRRPWLIVAEPKIHGKLAGHHVSVTIVEGEEAGSPTTFTSYRVHYHRGAGKKLDLTRDGFKAAGKCGIEGLTADANGKLRDIFKTFPATKVRTHEASLDLVGVSDGPRVMAVLHELTTLASALCAEEKRT